MHIKIVRFIKFILLLNIFCLCTCFFSSCVKKAEPDYSFQTLYENYWGQNEEEFLKTYSMKEGWERTESTMRDFRQVKHNRIVYSSKNVVELVGFPCEMTIQFTEEFGLTGIWCAASASGLTQTEYYDAVFALYDSVVEVFGEPGYPGTEYPDAVLDWHEYGDIDHFFTQLTPIDGTDITSLGSIWGKVSDEYPLTTVEIASRCTCPFEENGDEYLELKISRDITEGAQ